MTRAAEMLRTHPRPPQVDVEALASCISECFDCAQACAACADACLGEQSVRDLVRCIRLNEDCKAACLGTGETLSRMVAPAWNVLRLQLEACRAVCQECAGECERHAGHMEHCRVCAEACRGCEEACSRLLAALPA